MANQPQAVLKNEGSQRWIEKLNRDVEEGLGRLEAQMLSGQSEAFLESLRWWARLHRYSFSNAMLIRMQAPEASVVAGYKRFQEMGFQVRKGAMSIRIRAPWIKKSVDQSTGEIEQRLIGYFPVSVFSIQQTVEWAEGKRPPDPLTPATGADFEDLFIKWTRRLTTLYGFRIKEQALGGNVYGMATKDLIIIRRDLDWPQKVTTLLHEASHLAGKHLDQRDRPDKDLEAEAEAACFVLCLMQGIEHQGAKEYLLHWKIEPDSLKGHLEAIQRIVKDVCAWLAPARTILE